MKKYTIIGGVMTLAIVCTFIAIGSTYANNLDKDNGRGPKFQMTEEMKQNIEKIDTAIKNNDYETWKTLVSAMPGDRKISITEDAFAKEVERYKDRAAREELQGKIKAAIESGDYTTWQSLVTQLPNGADMLAKITEANFPKLVEANKLIEDGKTKIEQGQAIMDELGLPKPDKPPFGERGEGRRGPGGPMGGEPPAQEQEQN